MAIDRDEFGRPFKAARQATGLSQAEAAAAVGVPQPRIAEYEAGRVVPPTLRLLEIIEVIGLDPALLFPEFFISDQD
jgi:transcriptional regulator with XRE-family HTH domain